MYKAHREEYMKDMDRKWKEGAAERQRLWEEMKKRPKIVIPQVLTFQSSYETYLRRTYISNKV
jgi:hypothetical protein